MGGCCWCNSLLVFCLVELLNMVALQLVEDLAEDATIHVLDVEADDRNLLHAELSGDGEALLPVCYEQVPVGDDGNDEAPPLDSVPESLELVLLHLVGVVAVQLKPVDVYQLGLGYLYVQFVHLE